MRECPFIANIAWYSLGCRVYTILVKCSSTPFNILKHLKKTCKGNRLKKTNTFYVITFNFYTIKIKKYIYYMDNKKYRYPHQM